MNPNSPNNSSDPNNTSASNQYGSSVNNAGYSASNPSHPNNLNSNINQNTNMGPGGINNPNNFNPGMNARPPKPDSKIKIILASVAAPLIVAAITFGVNTITKDGESSSNKQSDTSIEVDSNSDQNNSQGSSGQQNSAAQQYDYYSSTKDGFRIRLPGEPALSTAARATSAGDIKATFYSFVVDPDEEVYQVMVADYSAAPQYLSTLSVEDLVVEVAESAFLGNEIQSKKESTLSGLTDVQEIDFTGDLNTGREYQIYLRGGKSDTSVFVIFSIGLEKAEFDQAVDSFELL